MESLRDQVVVITGASSGFGKGAALRFAEEGAHLVLAARRKGLLKELAKSCEKLGVKTVVVETDVSNTEDIEEVAEKAVEEFGRIDVWVNNAGVSAFGRFDEIPLKEHEQVIETNLLGCLYGSYQALRNFRTQGEGVLINLASYLGKGSAPYQSSYVASKHGIRGLDMAIRQELQANNESEKIHVCTLMPTSMDTPFFEHAARHGPHGKIANPDEEAAESRGAEDHDEQHAAAGQVPQEELAVPAHAAHGLPFQPLQRQRGRAAAQLLARSGPRPHQGRL